MSWPYVHLVVNHIPIILAVLGTAAALVAIVSRRRAVWLYATFTLILAGVTAYPAVFTGERAEHEVEELWYVSQDAIHEHEEAGELAMWALIAMGAISAVAWWRLARRPWPQSLPVWLGALVAAAALAGTSLVVYAGWQGGSIVHGSDLLIEQGAHSREPAAQ